MDAVTSVTGTVCPIDANDVDTDQIIPKQFLKRIERTGFGPYAFHEWRFLEDGTTPNPDFAMNKPEHDGASILLAGENFGCGSSREHAPWALEDAGFKAIIAPSFADIFRNNCAKIGVITVQIDAATVRDLFAQVAADPTTQLTVDLSSMTVMGGGVQASFTLDGHVRDNLMQGLDDIALTLQEADAITAFEAGRASYRPVLS
ncbi:MAG: 3-isopropylmalate/(R)-2-methylmalate dehydratase small subunit [Nitriliruptoraceae bacterium]|jgi:3-isopropylmalate/(R)-2-methylmalate dehydratase small subunit